VHRIGRTGRVGRSGRAITFVEPKQQRDLAAIEKHANTKIAPWAEGAHVAPAKIAEPPRRHHAKPRDERIAVTVGPNGDYRPLIASGGRAAGHSEADIVAAVHAAGIDGEAIRNVRLLERFALLEVPAHVVERVLERVDGTEIRGVPLRIEAARA
jgi:ATP-dependent RNA helicase DeaD